MIEVALFPIPNSVNFPGVPTPLHVFEPRFRDMVKYCIDNDVMMGVCHTQGVVRAIKHEQNPEEALSSNQSTYKPCDVFSAGKVELLKELDDGRLGVALLLLMLSARRPAVVQHRVVGDWAQCTKADGHLGLCMTDDVNTRTSISNVLDEMHRDLERAATALQQAHTALGQFIVLTCGLDFRMIVAFHVRIFVMPELMRDLSRFSFY